MSGTQVATWVGRELSGRRYRVDAQLGEGGMGTVFRAWDKNLSTEVVIKVPHAAMLQDAEFAARFAREISSLVKLSHPHIVKISDVGEQDGLPFAVMQFLPGGSLEDRQKSDSAADAKPLPPESLKSWLVSIAEALDFVHSQGYIHRDVKPANILFDAHGNAYLSDFGIAKSAASGPSAASNKTLTGSGMVIGTPEYMAPELIMGQTCDGRVDQYALAVTVFEMLAGRRPFEESTSTALYVQHATAEPPDLTTLSPDVSPAVAATIRRALSKSPDQRFASCRAFATVLLGAVKTFTASQPEVVDTKCPLCQSSLKLADRMRGKQLRCAGCHSMLHVSDDLQLMGVLSSDNETAARTTTRLASGTSGQAIISSIQANNSDRLQPDHVSENEGSKPMPAKSPASATQRAASLGEATLRSMSGKTIRPSMLASPKTKSPATQHEPQTATQPWMSVAGKLLWRVKSGEFVMGSNDGDADEKPPHRVRINRDFYLGIHEVNQREFRAVKGKNPSQFKGDELPVDSVGWIDSDDFCRRLTEIDRVEGRIPSQGWTYRLPTEAEWEFAARAGSSSKFAHGTSENQLKDYAWYGKNSGGKPHPCGVKKPNAWGFYDLSGNVWEWCLDWYDPNYYGQIAGPVVNDPVNLTPTAGRARRGGSWNIATNVCVANRDRGLTGDKSGDLAFRVALAQTVAELGGDTTVVEVELPPKPSSTPPKPVIAKSERPETVHSEKPANDLDKLISTSTGMEFALIPAGEFMMGSSDADVQTYIKADPNFKVAYANGEGPKHRVKITQPFYMASHEVTQAQYQQVVSRNPSCFAKTGSGSAKVSAMETSRFPVENVSWFDAVEFCIKLSAMDNRSPSYLLTNIKRSSGSITSAIVTILNGDGYRLPTEAEWEYVCRAKSTTPFHFGSQVNGEEANVNGNFPFGTTSKGPYLARTTTVCSYQANAFGLYDMHGNVWEWCQDWHSSDYYAKRAEHNPAGPLTGSLRVRRGGGWIDNAQYARAAYRSILPEGRGCNAGFRVIAHSSAR
jgi:formylglycine-generating enzyme required for sulfatase activity